MIFLSVHSRKDLEKLASNIADISDARDVIALFGDLGMGKTVFARSFIRSLSNADEDVPSPTFTLVQTYDTKKGEVWHFDLYRLKNADEIYEIGFEEALSDGISLIEWPQRAEKLLPKNRLEITLSPVENNPDARTVQMVPFGASWEHRLEKMKNA